MKLFCLLVAAVCCPAESPVALTADQLQDAIDHGAKFKTQEQYFQKGLKVKTQVDLVTVGASSRYVLAFGDWDLVAAESALAHQLMKPFTPADVNIVGNLHVLVKLYLPGVRYAAIHARYGTGQTNLVFQIGDTLLQPIQQNNITETETVASDIVVGSAWLLFHFQVDPAALRTPAIATFIDAKGKRNSHKIQLDGLTEPPR